MDKLNLYNSNQPNPLYNPTNFNQIPYENNTNSSFTKIDSASLIKQQPYPNYNQPNYSNNSLNIIQNASHLSQENHQLQSNGTLIMGNGTSKSNLGAGDQRYKNKYSFKRNTVVKSGLVSETKSGRAQQSRSFTINKQRIQNNTFLYQNRQIAGNSVNQYFNQNSHAYTPRNPSTIINNIQTNYIPSPINVVIPPPSPLRPLVNNIQTKPIVVLVNPQPNIIPSQPQPIVIPPLAQPQLVPFIPPITKPVQPPIVKPISPPVNPQPVNPLVIPEFVDKSQQYIKQIRDLRLKIEELQSQKLCLIDQVRYYEIQRFQTSSQETLRIYKQQIETLKQRISQINASVPPQQTNYAKNDREIEQLRQTLASYANREKQYQNQLIQAQNHIIYLQNSNQGKHSVNYSNQNFENEIKKLRQTIANYTEHLEHVELEKQEYKKYIMSKEQELAKLYEQNNILNNYLQQVQKGGVSQNGIDPNQYYSLLAEFGKKDLQVIILMQEVRRLQKEVSDNKGFLVKAEDYIVELQQQIQFASSGQTGQVNNSNELQLALEKELQKQATLKYNYEAEILKLNNLNGQISKQLKIYESEIATFKKKTNSSDISKIAELNQKIQSYQLEINKYKLEIQNITNTNTQLTQTINNYKVEINDYKTQITQINQTTTHQGGDQKSYEALVLLYAKKQLQCLFLLQEINRLNTKNTQITNHLQKAEDYIFSIQQHVKALQSKTKVTPSNTTPNTTSNTQLDDLRLKIKDLQGKLAASNQKLARVETKQATHFKEVQALQLKYKAIISQLDKNYNQLQSQKNSLALKLINLQKQSIKVTGSNVPSSKYIELQQSNKRLLIQIAEITEHLVRAQSHIKMNSQRWEKGHLFEREFTEKSGTLELLNKEIQLIKDQNVKLNENNIQLQKKIQQLSNSQTNAQNMTIFIRQKEQVEVLGADRQAQIEQLELSLVNYSNLYNQSQAKLTKAQKEIEGYKQQIKKFAELEGYLKKAEQFITEQELKWNSDIKNYETENLQIKNHLMGAQVHIKDLEEKLAKLNSNYIKIQQQNKAHTKENHEILQALSKAQKHIYQMEKIIHVK